ncbi:MAG: ParB/RepB/Spo0J family partition protein [Myxococcota bacterium]
MAARKTTSGRSGSGASRPKAKAGSARAKQAAQKKARAKRSLAPSRTKRGLEATEVALSSDDPAVAALAEEIRAAGGAVLCAYREPLAGAPLVLASLPLAAIEPTPFQRDLSPTHVKRLAQKIEESGSFLDPLIVVRGDDGRLWTPNGRHRLAAAKVLGQKQITALVSPDEALSFKILALNTEKAHSLKDRSLEVIRMARALAKARPRAKESDFANEFESAELLTLGIVYERQGRFAGNGLRSPSSRRWTASRRRPSRPARAGGWASRLERSTPRSDGSWRGCRRVASSRPTCAPTSSPASIPSASIAPGGGTTRRPCRSLRH